MCWNYVLKAWYLAKSLELRLLWSVKVPLLWRNLFSLILVGLSQLTGTWTTEMSKSQSVRERERRQLQETKDNCWWRGCQGGKCWAAYTQPVHGAYNDWMFTDGLCCSRRGQWHRGQQWHREWPRCPLHALSLHRVTLWSVLSFFFQCSLLQLCYTHVDCTFRLKIIIFHLILFCLLTIFTRNDENNGQYYWVKNNFQREIFRRLSTQNVFKAPCCLHTTLWCVPVHFPDLKKLTKTTALVWNRVSGAHFPSWIIEFWCTAA